MKIYRGGFTYGRAPLGPHASCVHEVSRYGVHARRVRSQAHTANGSASYFHRRHQETKDPAKIGSSRDEARMIRFCDFCVYIEMSNYFPIREYWMIARSTGRVSALCVALWMIIGLCGEVYGQKRALATIDPNVDTEQKLSFDVNSNATD